MKKTGFTLAEVLITLGIIGVVAAITLPALMTDTATAQIGPKLAKAVSVFEQANETLLNENSVDALTDTGYLSSTTTYGSQLSNYLKVSNQGSGKFLSKDGMTYTVSFLSTLPTSSGATPAHKQRIGDVTIDINGDARPNENATDIFYFSWWNDGSLRPKGGSDWDGSASPTTWKSKCKANTIPEDSTYCAGHVFENNLKVLYK